MKIKSLFFSTFLLFLTVFGEAQSDSLIVKPRQKKTFIKEVIFPVSLISLGIIISDSNFEKSLQKEIRNGVGNDFNCPIDNYTRYVPIVELYTADVLGVKAKNHWFDQSKNLALSIIITDFITFRLKTHIYKIRPSGGTESFPSAHTSSAFASATVLFQEFQDTSPLLAYSGYVFATTTGAFRMLNNAHWLSDVLVGAGIGMLVTNVIYYFDPIIKWNPFLKTKNVCLVPQIDNDQYGFYLSMRF